MRTFGSRIVIVTHAYTPLIGWSATIINSFRYYYRVKFDNGKNIMVAKRSCKLCEHKCDTCIARYKCLTMNQWM